MQHSFCCAASVHMSYRATDYYYTDKLEFTLIILELVFDECKKLDFYIIYD
jgi:hypothetical protein